MGSCSLLDGICAVLLLLIQLIVHGSRYNIQAGVHGFWIAGGTGESVLIEDDENKRMAEIAAELNKGRVTNIMYVLPASFVSATRCLS